MEDLIKHIEKTLQEKDLGKINEKFFEKNGYEKYFCEFFNMKYITTKGERRYWDVTWNDIKIELKKTKTNCFWNDEVRYAEMFLAKNNINYNGPFEYKHLAKEKTITIFIQTRKNKLCGLYLLDSDALFNIMSIDKIWSLLVLDRYNKMRKIGQSLNCQHKISIKDLINRNAKIISI